ncbi:MAG TPA: electron transport complex subunit RsxC [Gammaproteobacteria bacterium]|nr:electron transport complex subunit RsxC [Gammaproteobacteria bacterium]
MRLWSFHGGIEVPGHKEISTTRPVEPAPLPKRLILPLSQHLGAPAEPLVAEGEEVLKGQMIASPAGFVSAPLHASSSGKVVAIGEHPVPHPSGLSAPCITIETDGEERWVEREQRDFRQLEPAEIRETVRQAGIVGLGGAGFPAFIKLNPGRTIKTLILNGAECEPYITSDDMLMRERPEQILRGLLIIRRAVQARRCIIAVEDNKPEAERSLRQALGSMKEDADDIEIVTIPARYPAGGEKQLIRVVTGQEVPSGGLPVQVGVVCHNVSTAVAVYRAVELGEPLISRYVTITGGAVAEPRNLEVLIGTPVEELLQLCGTDPGAVQEVIMGGPMMGISLASLGVPLVKTGNCLLAVGRGEIEHPEVMPCIRCGNCAEACPMSLLPQQMYWHARAKDFDRLREYDLFDCIECGCCAYVCPSNIPLVHYYRFAKSEIRARQEQKRKADIARERHELREQRLAREKAERAARHARKRPGPSDESKKAAIQAALERARAGKQGAAQDDV